MQPHQQAAGWPQCLLGWWHHIYNTDIPKGYIILLLFHTSIKKQPWPSKLRSLGGQSWHSGISMQHVQTCSARWPSVAAEGELFDLCLFCLHYLFRVNKCRYNYQALHTIYRFITLAPVSGFHASASIIIPLTTTPFYNTTVAWPEEGSTTTEAEDVRTL